MNEIKTKIILPYMKETIIKKEVIWDTNKLCYMFIPNIKRAYRIALKKEK